MLWNKLYRRDIVEEHKLRMDTDISWCEDFMFNLEYIRYAKVFYALHAPIYYYVKRKGSLASQGINISKTVKMKLNVFEYYNNFYKHVLEEEDYEKNRLQVYRFLSMLRGTAPFRLQSCPVPRSWETRESLSIHRSCRRKDLQERITVRESY